MHDSLKVEGECNALWATLTAVDAQLPIAINTTPVVNQRQHDFFDIPSRHGCYPGTRAGTPVGTGKTALRKHTSYRKTLPFGPIVRQQTGCPLDLLHRL